MTQSEKLAYCAALIDGEGSLVLTKRAANGKSRHKRFDVEVKIAMNDNHGLLIFHEMFGGKISVGSKKINLKTGEEYCPAYVLRYSRIEKVRLICKSLMPYLQVKKEQAENILDFCDLKAAWNVQKALNTGSLDKFSYHGLMNNLFVRNKKLKQKNWIFD